MGLKQGKLGKIQFSNISDRWVPSHLYPENPTETWEMDPTFPWESPKSGIFGSRNFGSCGTRPQGCDFGAVFVKFAHFQLEFFWEFRIPGSWEVGKWGGIPPEPPLEWELWELPWLGRP